MLKCRYLLVLGAVVTTLLSCSENVNEGTVWDDPEFIRLTAFNQVLSNDDDVTPAWKLYDTLAVLDKNAEAVKLVTNDPGEGIFYSYEWTKSEPVFAVFPFSKNLSYSQDCVLNVDVPSTQFIASSKCPSVASVGTFTGNNTSYTVKPMRNILGYVRFKLGSSVIKSLKFEAIGDEMMAGEVDVDYGALESGEPSWTQSQGKQGLPAITLSVLAESSADEQGCIRAGEYYLALLPQMYEKGIKVTLESDTFSEPVVKEYSPEGGLSVAVNSVIDIEEDALDSSWPKVMNVVFDFEAGWPFEPEVLTSDQQTQSGGRYSGDTYTYRYVYQYGGVDHEEIMSFFIRGNRSPYNYVVGSHFEPGSNRARITIPAVSGRRVSSIILVDADGNENSQIFKLQNMSWDDVDLSETLVNAAYYMIFSSGAKVKKITIQYTK